MFSSVPVTFFAVAVMIVPASTQCAIAPLMRVEIAQDARRGDYLLIVYEHHIVNDHIGLEVLIEEINEYLRGAGEALPAPVPYREFVAQTLEVAGSEEARDFFRARLRLMRSLIGTRRDLGAAQAKFFAHFFRRVVVEVGNASEVAPHAQHLPARAAFAQRLGGAREALPQPFEVHVGARGFHEGADGQQHVRHGLQLLVGERRGGLDELGGAQRLQRFGIDGIRPGLGAAEE